MRRAYRKWKLGRIIRRTAKELEAIQDEHLSLNARRSYVLGVSGKAHAELLRLELTDAAWWHG